MREDLPEGYYFLGDVVVSLDQVKKQAKKFKATEAEELARVVAHGVLHLLGYKDKSKEQKAKIKKGEDKILDRIFKGKG